MVNFLVVVSIVGLFMAYELKLQFVAIFRPKALISYTEKLQRRAVRSIFAGFGAYRGWRPRLESKIEGELPERFMLIANHQSLFDIPIVWNLLPARCRMRFVAKRELGTGVPFVSSLLRVQGHALVSRKGDMFQAMKNLERFGKHCRAEGLCPVLFPEGTRSRTGELGPFHTAGFRKLIELDPLPVLVAAIEGGSWVSTLGALLRNLGRYPYTVRLVALLPAPRGKKEILATLERGRDLISEALDDMRRAAPDLG